MRASYIEIRYDRGTQRFSYPINMNIFRDWVGANGVVYVEELALVGYQSTTDFSIQVKLAKAVDVLPIEKFRSKSLQWITLADEYLIRIQAE